MSPCHLSKPWQDGKTFPIIEFVFFSPLWPARSVSYITLCGYPLEPGRDLEVSEEEVYLVR